MELKEVNKRLNEFGKYVVQQARTRLSKSKKNNTKELYNSLYYWIEETEQGSKIRFEMEDYGMYQDLGVKGKNPSLVKNGKQKAPNSPFKYKTKMPPMKSLMGWAKKKNIRFRDSQGKYTRGNYQTIAFWLQKRIFAQGIKPSLFFTKPFEKAYKDLPDMLANDFGIDFDKFLDRK
tara:strand:+ start:234 stop:761 length:528 start_codon:yes stop_codon:yes gene_type:complete